MRGRFITFEGGEGSGKSTQIALLKKAFDAAGLACRVTREPGGTPGAERIRALVVDREAEPWDARAELLLFLAARVEHVQKVILPALEAGTHVLCDRFADSTEVYQGIGKGVGSEAVRRLHAQTLGNFMPDLTVILDLPPAVGLRRAGARQTPETRFEEAGEAFHDAVQGGFLAIARREPERCAVVDASGSIEAVQGQVAAAVRERLGLELPERKAAHAG